jgi:hypothetical protein
MRDVVRYVSTLVLELFLTGYRFCDSRFVGIAPRHALDRLIVRFALSGTMPMVFAFRC